jgi:hypothetical protein
LKGATAEDVYVQVKDGLARARARIYHGAVTALGESLFVGDAGGDAQQVSERSLIFLRSIVKRVDVLARDDQHMNGRLRVEIAKGDAQFVLVDDIGGKLARDDSTEKAALFRHKSGDK